MENRNFHVCSLAVDAPPDDLARRMALGELARDNCADCSEPIIYTKRAATIVIDAERILDTGLPVVRVCWRCAGSSRA